MVALGAALPDLDYLLFPLNPYLFITEWHRGITHSLLMLPLWALLCGAAAARFIKSRNGRCEAVVWFALGLFTHIVFDSLTVYGTRILAPFDHRRIAAGLSFDADLYAGVIAWAAVAAGYFHRSAAGPGLVVLGFYFLLQIGCEQSALRIAHGAARRQPAPPVSIHALPQPLSPFFRKLVIRYPDHYRIAWLDARPAYWPRLPFPDRLTNVYQPEQLLHWRTHAAPPHIPDTTDPAAQVWWHPQFAPFRQFATLPVLYRIDGPASHECIWFTDLRYALPGMLPAFRYGMCRNSSTGDWQLYRLKRGHEHEKQRIGMIVPSGRELRANNIRLAGTDTQSLFRSSGPVSEPGQSETMSCSVMALNRPRRSAWPRRVVLPRALEVQRSIRRY